MISDFSPEKKDTKTEKKSVEIPDSKLDPA